MLDLATNSLSGELPLNLFNLTAYIFGMKVVLDCTLGVGKITTGRATEISKRTKRRTTPGLLVVDHGCVWQHRTARLVVEVSRALAGGAVVAHFHKHLVGTGH
jgi:hypothetical protein